jgi:hypothetical protein
MARKTQKPLTIAHSAAELLAQDRHTDWVIAQERGATRNGRSYIVGGAHGSDRTKAGRSKSACRGRVRDY